MIDSIVAERMHRPGNDYFKNVGNTELALWYPIMLTHAVKCKNKECIKFRRRQSISRDKIIG